MKPFKPEELRNVERLLVVGKSGGGKTTHALNLATEDGKYDMEDVLYIAGADKWPDTVRRIIPIKSPQEVTPLLKGGIEGDYGAVVVDDLYFLFSNLVEYVAGDKTPQHSHWWSVASTVISLLQMSARSATRRLIIVGTLNESVEKDTFTTFNPHLEKRLMSYVNAVHLVGYLIAERRYAVQTNTALSLKQQLVVKENK
jgi:adenosyl cobinamide kinase/adenosyl cobinamide phosphate guanylyltransferase